MGLYRIKQKKLEGVEERSFKLEKELQKLTEDNLDTLFGLEFVASEFERNGLRIDTLAYDPENKAFVIIEYKRDQGFSVVDQGLAYLGLMLDHKAEFVLEYNEKHHAVLARKDIDWSQSRVMFIMRSFSPHQQRAANFDLPIELWEVIRYANDSVVYNHVQTGSSRLPMRVIGKDKEIAKVAKEVKTYQETDLLPTDEKRRKLYEQIKERLFDDDPELFVHVTKAYPAFRRKGNWRNLVVIWFRANKVRLEIMRTEPKDVKDPEKRVHYIADSYKYFHQHISYIEVASEDQIDYAIYVLKQALKRFQK